MSVRVAITGMGIISSIGSTLEEHLTALESGASGISRLSLFESIHSKDIWVGEIKKSNSELQQILNLPDSNRFTRTAMLGAYAAQQAVLHAGIADVNQFRTGLISSTTVGGMDFSERYFYRYFDEPEIQKYIGSHDAGESSHQIADYLGLKGFVSTISTACSSAANAVMLGCRLIQSGKLDRVIVGGTDALSKFTINGFKTLMILSDAHNSPFDHNRKGLNLGEAAAYLVLESETAARASQKRIWGYVAGFGNANDAFHQTASSENGEGAFLAMQKALKMAQLKPSEIDYINVHGTATANNDLSEGRAIERLFEHKVPHFSSTKPYTGHTLAAAGGVEAVFSLLAINEGLVYPNLNFETPMEELTMLPQTVLIKKKLEKVLSNSFGFGGNCSALLFSKS